MALALNTWSTANPITMYYLEWEFHLDNLGSKLVHMETLPKVTKKVYVIHFHYIQLIGLLVLIILALGAAVQANWGMLRLGVRIPGWTVAYCLPKSLVGGSTTQQSLNSCDPQWTPSNLFYCTDVLLYADEHGRTILLPWDNNLDFGDSFNF